MDRRAVDDQTLIRGHPEHAAMSEIALSRFPCRGIFVWMPGILVGVKVQYCNGATVDLVERSESWEGYAVVST